MKFIDILQQHRIDYRLGGTHHHVTTHYLGMDCPYCSPNSNKFKLGYHLEKGFFSCWSCGFMPLVSTLCELTGLPPDKVRALLGKLERPATQQERPRGKLTLPKGLEPLQKAHRLYLRKRGLIPQTVESIWGVQGIGVAAKLSWRIFLPIRDSGKTVSWTTRSIGEQEPRYINARPEQEAIPAKKLLYGEDYARHAIVIVEGPMDAMRIGPGAVATLGVGYSRAQILKMIKYPVRAVCFDADAAGQQRAKKLCAELEVFPGKVYNIILDSGSDPGEASQKELNLIRGCFLENI